MSNKKKYELKDWCIEYLNTDTEVNEVKAQFQKQDVDIDVFIDKALKKEPQTSLVEDIAIVKDLPDIAKMLASVDLIRAIKGRLTDKGKLLRAFLIMDTSGVDTKSEFLGEKTPAMDLIHEQWSKYVDGAEDISQKRGHANNFYLSISTFVLSGIMAVIQLELLSIFIIVFSLIGIGLTGTWYTSITNYSEKNAVKYRIINEIEAKFFPLRVFWAEHMIFNKWIDGETEGDEQKAITITKIEKTIPRLFGVLFFSSLVYGIYISIQAFL